MTTQEVYENLLRDAVSIYSKEGLKEKLESGRRLKIKLGADPSRPDLHLGHSVVLRKLRMLQDLGHEIVFVIGDFTDCPDRRRYSDDRRSFRAQQNACAADL